MNTPTDGTPATRPEPSVAAGAARHSIAWRLVALVTTLIAVTTIALSVAEFVSVRNLLRSSLERQLLLYGQGLTESITAFVKLQQERAQLVSSRTRLRELLAGQQDGSLSTTYCQPRTHKILRDATESIDSFRLIRIANPDGLIVASSDTAELGIDVSNDLAFVAGHKGVHLSPPTSGEHGFHTTLSAPVRGEGGVELGVVLVKTDATQLNNLVGAMVSGYKTARVRLATTDATCIRYLLPIDGEIPAQQPASADPAMALALSGKRGFLDSTEYQGRMVVAAYSPSGYRDWGLVVQLDADEAYAPSRSLLGSIILVGLVCCGIALAIGLRLARTFVKPIERLSETALAIEAGDFTARASSTTRDEVGVLADILNSMAASLQGYQHEMQRQVDARTEDLEISREQLRIAKEHAESANNAKTRFLAGMSHEIRTPMNGVIGMTEILLQSDLSPVVRHRVEVVHESGKVLLRLLNDILDLSKVEAGKLTLVDRDFSIHELCHAIKEGFEPAIKNKDIELFCTIDDGTPPLVRGDADRIRQVLNNLVGNAIKFTDRGHVSMHIAVTDSDDGGYRLIGTVSDTGVGIPQDQQAMVFQRFHQIGPSDHYVQTGTGLGLTISNKLVQRMGGTLSLESEPGDGSKFTFDIKLRRPQGAQLKPMVIDDASATQQPCTVLLVEDGEVNREVARTMLEMRGHKVIEAQSGLDAISMLEHRDIDVVLMDIQMPEMDGWEATRWIRKAEAGSGKRLPIIGLSAHALRGFRQRCLDAGMDDFLTKPTSSRKLIRAVESWANVARGATKPAAPAPTEPIMQADQTDAGPAADSARESFPDTRATALQRCGGLETTLKAIVQTFAADVPRRLDAIDAAMAAGSASDCRREAHTLKGAADLLAMVDLRSLAARIEELARNEDLIGARQLVPTLRAAAQTAVEQARSW